MLLRPRQKQFVERSVGALAKHGNTLGVAPTGAGKTIMLSAVAGDMVGGTDAKACVLAHRDELTEQNRSKFARVHPKVTSSVVDAKEKSWAGQVTFAMVPTLARAANLDRLPTLDLLVIDEAHHAAADSYRRIIDRVRERNPAARIYGVTATPNREPRADDADRRKARVLPGRDRMLAAMARKFATASDENRVTSYHGCARARLAKRLIRRGL